MKNVDILWVKQYHKPSTKTLFVSVVLNIRGHGWFMIVLPILYFLNGDQRASVLLIFLIKHSVTRILSEVIMTVNGGETPDDRQKEPEMYTLMWQLV